VRARIVTVESLGSAAARQQKGLRIFVRDAAPLEGIRTRLATKGEGEVTLVVVREAEGEEIEIRLPGGYFASAAVADALKVVPGVIAVEHV